MEESKKSHKVGCGCKSRLMEELAECIATEDRASIYKTPERNCFCECER